MLMFAIGFGWIKCGMDGIGWDLYLFPCTKIISCTAIEPFYVFSFKSRSGIYF